MFWHCFSIQKFSSFIIVVFCFSSLVAYSSLLALSLSKASWVAAWRSGNGVGRGLTKHRPHDRTTTWTRTTDRTDDRTPSRYSTTARQLTTVHTECQVGG